MSLEHDSASEQKTKGARTESHSGNGTTGNIPPNSMVVDTSVLSQLLDGKFETAAKRSENHIDTSIKGLRDEIETLDKKHDKKHSDTASALSALERKINSAVESFTNIAAANATTMQETAEAAVLSARAAVPHGVGNLPFGFQPPPEDGYNRAPIPSRLKLFAIEAVTLLSAKSGAKAMCDKAGIDETDYQVEALGNPGLSRLFAIDFLGDPQTAALRAKKARGCLRSEDGSWMQVKIPTPSGDTTQAYINPDKSPKVERVEKLSKFLLKICANEYSDQKFFVDRATGTIKCGWTPIAIIAAPTSSEISLKWNNGGIVKAGIDKAIIKTAFDLATGSAANVEWSS